MLRPFCLSLALLSLLAFAHPAPGQSLDPAPISFASALSGKFPLSLKLKDLDSGWRQFTLAGSTDVPGSYASNIAQLYLTVLSGGSQNTYYTQGNTVTLSGEVYLVAYHHAVHVDYAALLKSDLDMPPPLPKLTPDTALSLSLLSLHSIGSLNDIQEFSLQDALNPPAPAVPAPDPQAASDSNLKQLGLAVLQYVQDYDETLPPMKSAAVAKKALYPYVRVDTVFQEPPSNTLFQPNTSLSHRKMVSFASPISMVIYYAPAPQADGLRAVLFLDDHVQRVTNADWQRLKIASHVPNPPQGVQ